MSQPSMIHPSSEEPVPGASAGTTPQPALDGAMEEVDPDKALKDFTFLVTGAAHQLSDRMKKDLELKEADRKSVEEKMLLVQEENKVLRSDKLGLENKVNGFEAIEKALQDRVKELEGQVERLEPYENQVEGLLAENKDLKHYKRRVQSSVFSPEKSDAPAKTLAEAAAPATSPVHQVARAPKVDAAPSSNLEEDDDGFVTAPEGPEASGENKGGTEAVPTLQVLVEERESGAETGASNEGGEGKASPTSVPDLDVEAAKESSGEEVESEARAEQQESQDDADILKPHAGGELASAGSEKRREKREEAKAKARVWSENRKKTPKKTKAAKKTNAKRRCSARIAQQK